MSGQPPWRRSGGTSLEVGESGSTEEGGAIVIERDEAGGAAFSHQSDEALVLTDVEMAFRDRNGQHGRKILDGISMQVRRGELVCVLGASGCGKTTLLRICAGLEAATRGSVRMYGVDVSGVSRERVVVFQDATAALFGWRTVLQNVEFGIVRRPGERVSKRAARSEAGEWLDLVGLSVDGEKYPHQLSGGGRQRLQIARALAVRPQVLLMDEPLASLDALTKLRLQDEIVSIARRTNATILYVTHDIVEAVRMASRIVVLGSGESGPTGQIALMCENSLPHPREYGSLGFAELLRKIENVVLRRTAG